MRRFEHQVGGHSTLLKPADPALVYKPFTAGEFKFYERINSRPPQPPQPPSQPHSSQPPTSLHPLIHSHSTSEVEQHSKKLIFIKTFSAPTSSLSGAPDPSQVAENQIEILKNFLPKYFGVVQINAVDQTPATTTQQETKLELPTPQKYIVLEDLVFQCKKPCVMDLKMGLRQRSANASVEKSKNQIEKSLRTTSHSIGFRLCGCQFYDKKNDVLCFRDKYWGRKLTRDKLIDSIQRFFWNGFSYFEELIPPILSSLKALHQCLSGLSAYRFWSSSLLLLFDGGSLTPVDRLKSLKVKMIDFSNTVIVQSPKPHLGYIFGLENLIKILQHVQHTISYSRPPPLSKKHGSLIDFYYPVAAKHLSHSQPDLSFTLDLTRRASRIRRPQRNKKDHSDDDWIDTDGKQTPDPTNGDDESKITVLF